MTKNDPKNDNASRKMPIFATCKSAICFVIFCHFVEILSIFLSFWCNLLKNEKDWKNSSKNDRKMTDKTEMTKKTPKRWQKNDRQNWNDKKPDKKWQKKITDKTEMTKQTTKNDKKNDRQSWNDKNSDKKMTDKTEMTKKRQKMTKDFFFQPLPA